MAKAKAEAEKSAKAKAVAEKKAQAAAAKKSDDGDEDDEEESPELLTSKLKPLLRMVAKVKMALTESVWIQAAVRKEEYSDWKAVAATSSATRKTCPIRRNGNA